MSTNRVKNKTAEEPVRKRPVREPKITIPEQSQQPPAVHVFEGTLTPEALLGLLSNLFGANKAQADNIDVAGSCSVTERPTSPQPVGPSSVLGLEALSVLLNDLHCSITGLEEALKHVIDDTPQQTVVETTASPEPAPSWYRSPLGRQIQDLIWTAGRANARVRELAKAAT